MWTIVIPVKPPELGKSRLQRTPEVARAIALDTIEAAVGAGQVIVVTADATLVGEAGALGAQVVLESVPTGLADAIARGIELAGDAPRAVLLGDLPGLLTSDLVQALERAESLGRAFVADAEGTGSTLVTAGAGSDFQHAFGPGSAEAHRAAGLMELDAGASLRRDVDLPEHLAGALGPRTTAALRGAG